MIANARTLSARLADLLRAEQVAMADFLVQARTWVTFWTWDMGDSSLSLG
jgi:hypothetical protein